MEELTPRERDVLSLLVAGQTSAEIAQALSVSASTVALHNSHIFRKLGVRSRTQAILKAQQLGLLAAPGAARGAAAPSAGAGDERGGREEGPPSGRRRRVQKDSKFL